MDLLIGHYHQQYCFVHREWYESFDQYHPDDELLQIARGTICGDWVFRRDGIWISVAPPSVRLPRQGWKIHISSSPDNCQDILRCVAQVCSDERLAFKFAADCRLAALQGSKIWSRAASGKFITIYPLHEEHFCNVIQKLHRSLLLFKGPYILSDKRYADSGIVYYRYGGIAAMSELSVAGHRQPVILAPSGEKVPDIREPYYTPPEWVSDPFPTTNEEDEGGLCGGRYEVERALAFSVSGGVYVARDQRTGDTVVLKEARPYTGMDANNIDATSRLRKEYRLLQRLQDANVTPAPIDLFQEWEHLFLAEEHVTGQDLAQFTIANNPLLFNGHCTPQSSAVYADCLRRVWSNLARGIQAIHARGVVFGDLSLRNVLLINQETGELRFIDLEGAWEEGVDQPSPWFGTPGYRAPGGACCMSDDLYSLGSVMLGTLFPMNSFLVIKPAARHAFLDEISKDLNLPKAMSKIISDLMSSEHSQRPTPAQIVEILSNDCV